MNAQTDNVLSFVCSICHRCLVPEINTATSVARRRQLGIQQNKRYVRFESRCMSTYKRGVGSLYSMWIVRDYSIIAEGRNCELTESRVKDCSNMYRESE